MAIGGVLVVENALWVLAGAALGYYVVAHYKRTGKAF